MTGYGKYVFLLCLLVFIVLVLLLSVLFAIIIRYTIKLIKLGGMDDKIKDELNNYKKTKMDKAFDIVNSVVSITISAVLTVSFLFALIVSATGNSKVGDIPLIKVVASASMSYKYVGNEYLFENNLNNQFQTYDMVVLKKMPKEMDLKLYDIVMYQFDNSLILHRIVGIEEPNSSHPKSRLFTFQGDAVSGPDALKVQYSQMRAIYSGQKISFMGGFIYFMQSPVGGMCILLIIVVLIILPIFNKKLLKAKEERIRYLKSNNKMNSIKTGDNDGVWVYLDNDDFSKIKNKNNNFTVKSRGNKFDNISRESNYDIIKDDEQLSDKTKKLRRVRSDTRNK